MLRRGQPAALVNPLLDILVCHAMGGRESLAGQADALGLAKEGRDCVSFMGMQEGKPGIFQTLQIQHTCSQAIEKDEDKSSFSLHCLLGVPRERLTGKDSWDRDLGTRRLNGHKLRNTMEGKGIRFCRGDAQK